MKETLEEAAERLFPFTKDDSENRIITIKRLFWIDGAKWQQERMYSEEDMKQFGWECVTNFLSNNVNEVEMALVEVIIDRNSKQFEKFKK
jgi:hypothetical protein